VVPIRQGERMQTWQAVFLGLVEGLTEFLPVSSTGHLILAGHFLGVETPGKAFEILIQLGAILAILTVYAAKLMRILADLPHDRRTQLFALSVVIAFLPAAVIGVLLHRHIKALLEYPLLVCLTLIGGGIVLLAVDRMRLRPRIHDAMDITPMTALKIGACQCLAMIPGVSRSGATIVGAMLFGTSKVAAAEFSFFLAMPTMAGAFSYDLYKNWSLIDAAAAQSILIGFVVAFVTGALVVRYLLDFVSRRGFAPFGWYRIALGGLGLGALAVLG
jgi:undecaprenyl-diphosphatase